MPREIVTFHVGQCGNQIGGEFWRRMLNEHGINDDGTLISINDPVDDCKDIFFYQADDEHFTPRAILCDLEPRVVNAVRATAHGSLFPPENVFLSKDGGGAGNNWASGFGQAEASQEALLEMVDKELEAAENAQAFILCHSIAGGTGSGMGSYLLQSLVDRFPKMLLQTFSVFPMLEPTASDVVVQPYNALLTLKRLTVHADSVVALDNAAVHRIYAEHLGQANPTLSQTNALMSGVMAAVTSTLRFPGYQFGSLQEIVSPLVPTPRCHYLTAAFAPIALDTIQPAQAPPATSAAASKRTSAGEVMRCLLLPKFQLVSIPAAPSLLALLQIVSGEVTPVEVHQAMTRIREKQLLNFVRWTPATFLVARARRSPYVPRVHKVTGAMLANNTAVSSLFEKCLQQFRKLMNRRAFLENYRKVSSFDMTEFDDAADVVEMLVDEYRGAETDDFGGSFHYNDENNFQVAA